MPALAVNLSLHHQGNVAFGEGSALAKDEPDMTQILGALDQTAGLHEKYVSCGSNMADVGQQLTHAMHAHFGTS